MKVCCIIPAKNEEKFIGKCLHSLKNQTVNVDPIIVIDDESTDETSKIAHEYTQYVYKSNLTSKDSKFNDFRLSEVYNIGFEKLEEIVNSFDYLMVLDADTILPNNYLAKIIGYMEEKNLELCSGVIEEEEHFVNVRGSGRILTYNLFNLIDKRYPTNYGFDTYPASICLVNNLKFGVQKSVKYRVQRPTLTNYSKVAYVALGRGCRAYGYILPFALHQFFKMGIQNKKPNILLFGLYGYLTLKKENRYDQRIRKAFQKYQWSRIRSIFNPLK